MADHLHGRWATWTRKTSAACSWWYVRHSRLGALLIVLFFWGLLIGAFAAMYCVMSP